MKHSVQAGVLALMLTGCVLGPTVAGYTPANTIGGLELTVQIERRSITGELLAVEDTALMMVVRFPNPDSSDTPRLARVATRRIQGITGPVSSTGRWTATLAAKYRPLSRYPQGVNTDLEARLAAAYGVPAVRWIPQ